MQILYCKCKWTNKVTNDDDMLNNSEKKLMTYDELVEYTEEIIHYATGTASRCYPLWVIYQFIDDRIETEIEQAIDDLSKEELLELLNQKSN